jgi:preprotein translocase subunit SecY
MTIEAEILNGGETVPEFFKLYFVASIVGGVFFLVWIGEKIKESGIGNGISLIIFVGIVATIIPSAVEFFELIWTGQFSEWQFVLVLLVLAVLLFVAVLFETASRKIPLQSSRVQAQGLQQAQESYLPIKVNISGVIAPIFASALLTLPSLVVSFLSEYAGDSDIIAQILASLGRGQPLYLLFYGALIMFFCFFYVGVVFDSNDVANNLKKSGVVLQGIRPGDATREFIDRVLFYLTVLASIYLLFICLVPEIANSYYGLPFYLGGTSILIIVSVVIDTFTQAQSYLFSKQYKKMIKKSGFGRR